MRKIFGGSLVFSLVGVALLGGVFAWTFSASESGESTVGSVEFAINYNETENTLGPDGATTFAGGGGGGAFGDFALAVAEEGASVHIDSVAGNDGTCTRNMFSGWVEAYEWDYPITEEGVFLGDWEYRVYIHAHDDDTIGADFANPNAVPAQKACQGRTVAYTINIDAYTTGDLIGDAADAYQDEDDFSFDAP